MSLFDLKKKDIGDLEVGDTMDNYCKVLSMDKRNKKDGEPFLTLVLMDKSGKIKAKVWNNVKKIHKLLKAGEVYKFSGMVNEFKGEKDVRITNVIKADPDQYNIKDFIEKPQFDTEIMMKEMKEIFNEVIKNEKLNELIDLVFKRYGEELKNHYGAMNIHHAYTGGLLKHTASLVKLSAFIADQYNLNKEILVTGALMHDIGKIFEFSVTPALKINLEGGLMGHIVIGNNILLELTSEIKDFPKNILIQLQHLILSHHGEKEYGSPEVPKTKEALALHITDLLDSRFAIFDELKEKSDKNELFSEFSHPLGNRILIKNELE